MLTIRTTGLDDYLDGGTGRIKVLMMGPPGSGKTRSASSWPKPLLADCEEGRMSVADRAIPYAAIKSTAEMKGLLDLAEAESKRPKDQRRFETLVIDTLDAYQRIVIQEYLKTVRKATMSGWQDWGHLDAEMTELVARLSGLAMNVVVNLHVKDTKVGGTDDGDGGYLVKSPKLKGDLKDQIAAEFDLVGFMETGWEAIDGKRTLSRYVQWEPSPDKPILKDRSGQLPARTPVDFTTEDYDGLLRPLQLAMEALTAGSVVAEVATEVAAEPVAVGGGGSVAKPATAKKAATKTAAKAPAASKKTPAAPPAVTTPVPAAPVPLVEPKAVPVTEAEAIHTVETVLGGEVINGNPDANGSGNGFVDRQTPVATPEPESPGAVSIEEVVDTSVPETAADIPGNGTVSVACGQPRYTGGSVPPGLAACGQEMVLEMQEDRVTGCSTPAGQIPDLIQIAGLKTRAFLCNACFATHRKSPKKEMSHQ